MDFEKGEENRAFDYPPDSLSDTHADNSLKVYEARLGFDRSSLEGKRVLDLGIGQTDRLARELKKSGINAQVVGISPDLTTSITKDDLEHLHPDWKREAVEGLAQALPFKDNSFDFVLGLYSVTYYSSYPEQVQAWVSEIARVLKPGGEARLGPKYTDSDAEKIFGEDYRTLIELVKKAGLDVEVGEEYILMQKPLL